MEDKAQVHRPVSYNSICLDLLEMGKAAKFNINHLITKYSSNFLYNMVQYDGISALRERTRVDKRVFWPQYFRKIENVSLIGFRLK